MELYLLKSAGILLVLFLFYKIVLENTSAHQFKRFYLLGSVLLAFIIPFITFTTYIEVPAVTHTVVDSQIQFVEGDAVAAVNDINYFPFILGTIYGLGVLYFLIRFVNNVRYFGKKIKNSKRVPKGQFVYSLVTEKTTPHTFLKYIFLEKEPFEKKQIPQVILTHEETHARERHSLDILFFELVQIVFWFNPLFYFIKRSCKLNHEFLADSAVLSQGTSTALYQQLLLSFINHEEAPALANAIHYSAFKKRFTLMKTQTRQKNLWLRTALLLPLIGLLAYSCAEHKTEYVQEVAMLDEVSNVKIIDLNVLADNQLEYNQAIISVEQLPQIIKNEKYTTAALNVSPLVDVAFAKSVVATLVEMGVSKKMSVCTATEDGASLTKEDFNEIMSPLSGLYAKNNSTQISDETGTILVDGVLHFYVSKGDKIDYYDRWGNLVDVTGKTLTEKKMKTTTERVLKGQDSNIPPPPQSSKSVSQQFQETGTVEVDGEIHFFITQNKKTTYYNRWGNLIDVTGKSLTNKVLKSSTRKVRKGEASDIPPPPNPPTPPVVSTDKLDQVIRLAKEYAAFSYEGNPITSDKAIALIKENKSLYILVRRFKNSNPIVDITEDKVTFIENANGWKAPNDMSPSESPTKDPASVLEPYIKKNATFFIDKKPATPEEAKKLMRSDRGANLKIRTTKEGKTIVMIQGC